MRVPLPVMANAYERYVRPPEDPYGVVNDLQQQEARQYVANAELMALRSCGNLPNSGTLPSQDLIFAIAQDDMEVNPPYTSAIAKASASPIYTTTANDTSDVIFVVLKDNLERFYKVIAQSKARTIADTPPAATNPHFAVRFFAKADSTTTRQPIEDRYTWLKLVYGFVHLGQTSKALRVIYASVEDHFKRDDLKGLGQVVAEVDIGRLNPQTMTALLRISGRAKRALPSWKRLLERISSELKRLKVPDLPGLMVGLVE